MTDISQLIESGLFKDENDIQRHRMAFQFLKKVSVLNMLHDSVSADEIAARLLSSIAYLRMMAGSDDVN